MTNFTNIIRLSLAFILIFLSGLGNTSKALSPDAYASSSRLAEGRWVKITIPSQGLYTITADQLRQMGFTNPDKVNVFGYGGRLIPEVLEPGLHPDDMPLVPSVYNASGLSFYAFDLVSWKGSSTAARYARERNPYSSESYYFLSDIDVADATFPESFTARPGVSDQGVTTFWDHIIHEQNLATVATTGRLVLGEDFRSTTARKFNFSLPGNQGDATVQVAFGSAVTGGKTSLNFLGNGKALTGTSKADEIKSLGTDEFICTGNFIKTVPAPGEKLELEVRASYSGVVSNARLDYIIVEYSRPLTISTDGYLAFWHNTRSEDPAEYIISGATAETLIWDITVPGAPMRVDFQLSGGKAMFSDTYNGYREYLVVNPSQVKGTKLPQVGVSIANQDLHALPVPDMLIIAPAQFTQQAERVAALHRDRDGMVVHVLTPQAIYNEFSSATPDISAWRRILKMWYDRGEQDGHILQYCMIMGRPTNNPLNLGGSCYGEVYLPIWESVSGTTQTTSFSTDDLVAMLEDATTSSFQMARADLSIGIGRMPVSNETEARQAVDKLEQYITEPDFGSWRNNMILIADDGDRGDHLDQSQDVYNAMRASGDGWGEHYLYDRIYLDAFTREMTPVGVSYPTATSHFLNKLDEGALWLNYIGHASTSEWTHDKFLTWTDINSMNNRRWPFMYAATCDFARWDDGSASGAEVMWLNTSGGVIGLISASRKVYIQKNGPLGEAAASQVFETTSRGKMRLGDIIKNAKNTMKASQKDDNRLRYLLIGDPAMALPVADRLVALETLDGHQVSGLQEPVVKGALGRAKISGSILNAEGLVDVDFDGELQCVLMDAEEVVETHGYDSPDSPGSGEVRLYNDRRINLFRGKASVKEGRWEMEVKLPYEIANNYSPALLNFYAYSTKGAEAVGHSEDLIIYGFDPEADLEADQEGPEITLMTLNNSNFKNGDQVNPSPMVIAEFSDPSGLNLSNGSIGHNISLQLDNDKPLTDVSDYFTPEIDNPDAGRIAYPLTNVEPGRHSVTLTVWDNANNFSKKTISFCVSANAAPLIYDITTDVNPATTSVTFLLNHDHSTGESETLLEVFDLSGRKVWSASTDKPTGFDTPVSITWDLRDKAGVRVPRGIYIYRATVTAPNGVYATKSKKLAVTAAR